MNRMHSLITALALGLCIAAPLALPSAAQAQPAGNKKKALASYERGRIQYDLGKWDEAIKHFEAAYEAYPDPAFLFNIAQAHRQAGHCKKSVFFFTRFLALNPDAPNRQEIEGFVAEQETGCTTSPTQSSHPDSTTTTGDPDQSGDAGGPESEGSEGTIAGADLGGRVETQVPADDARMLMAQVSVGSSFISGGDLLDTPAQFNLNVGAGYPIALGSLTLDAGALVSYTPVAWERGEASGTTSFTGLLANVGLTKELLPKLSGRAELGAGLMLVSGLGEEMNVFADDGAVVDDPALSPSVRVALGVEYALSSTMAIRAQPLVLSFASAPEGMREGIDSLTAFQALFGIGLSL